MPKTPGGQRETVTRDRAVDAAITLADREGIDAVSMRNLAAQLGVVPMALYKHIANKEDLLNGMADALILQYGPPTLDPGWIEGVRSRILSARSVLLRHPWARKVFETRTSRTPAVLSYMDSLAGMFIAGGVSVDLTHHAMHALGHRIWGFSPEAFEDPQSLRAPSDPNAQAALAAHVRATYPSIFAIAMESTGGHATATGCDEQFEFEFTLDLLLDGFARLHERGWNRNSHVEVQHGESSVI